MRAKQYVVGFLIAAAALLAGALSSAAWAAETKLMFPLRRTAYQTDEAIDLAIVRSGDAELAAGELRLALRGDDGSVMEFSFQVDGGGKRRTEHLQLDGRLLRPGDYTAEVSVDGASDQQRLTLVSHVRESSFRLISWGARATGEDLLRMSADNLGYNYLMKTAKPDEFDMLVRAGVDTTSNCVMSGGHQMDLRMECDWSDPYVLLGAARRVARQAFLDRTRSNAFGVHFYDEPGLTWHKHPETGEFTPHMIPAQVRSFRAAFGRDPLPYQKVDPNSPDDVQRWRYWARWKLGLMDAAWQDAQAAVSYVRPDYISSTQSQYGFSAFTDGYYFNVVRSLPVTSGHGGYHDWGPGYFNPSFTLELARARDFDKPCWYMPTWYGNTTGDLYRLEQYLSFQTNLQGMASPPPLEPAQPAKSPATGAIVETNKRMARLGPIFNQMPVTRPPVAMLYSISDNIHRQTEDMSFGYAHAGPHGRNLTFMYLAGKRMQQQFLTVVEEDILDGTLAAQHKALLLTSIDYLPETVIAEIEKFIRQGGLVLATSDCGVKVDGAVDLGIAPAFPDAEKIAELQKQGKHQQAAAFMTLKHFFAVADPLSAAIRPHLAKAGIQPPLQSDQPGIVVTRQVGGDVEYLFAVNATHDASEHPTLGLQAVEAEIALPDDGRPVYDAVNVGPETRWHKGGQRLAARFRFGPGQMRVLARTQKPIGGVQLGTPAVRRSTTREGHPVTLEVSAAVLDDSGGLLAGAVPLEMEVADSLGDRRYRLYRSTDQGTLRLSLPLAANDARGQWTVTARELLCGRSDTKTFTNPAAPFAPMAGQRPRAVFFGRDRENVHRFFRVHQHVTIVTGASDFNAPAAKRLATALEPWGVQATIVDAKSVNKPRSLTEKEAKTWVGLNYASSGQIKPGTENRPDMVGFDVRGPVILLGNPGDNPLIEFLLQEKFLPYAPSADFPGAGRGMLAWQSEGVGPRQESITLIAHDQQGMSEAVGTLYEAAAGIDRVSPLVRPTENSLTAAQKSLRVLQLQQAWTAQLPDRIDALKVEGDSLWALAHDGTLAKIDAMGEAGQQRVVADAEHAAQREKLTATTDPDLLKSAQQAAQPGRTVKLVAVAGELRAVAYWGGCFQWTSADGKPVSAIAFDQDITALTTWGDKAVVGLADGRVVALTK